MDLLSGSLMIFEKNKKVLIMMQAVEIWYFLWVMVGVQCIFRVFGDLPFPSLHMYLKEHFL